MQYEYIDKRKPMRFLMTDAERLPLDCENVNRIAKFLNISIEYEEIFRNFAHINFFEMDDLKYNRIREVLVSRGIKQTWLAQQLGLTFRQINSYATNSQQPPIPTLYEIAKILNVPPFELLNPESKDELKKVRKSTKEKS